VPWTCWRVGAERALARALVLTTPRRAWANVTQSFCRFQTFGTLWPHSYLVAWRNHWPNCTPRTKLGEHLFSTCSVATLPFRRALTASGSLPYAHSEYGRRCWKSSLLIALCQHRHFGRRITPEAGFCPAFYAYLLRNTCRR
jgi:hypothetical protein